MSKTKDNKSTDLEIQDYIGRQGFVDKIINTINFASDKKSWTFAINGAWGSGKSFVLNMIEKELNNNQDYLIVKYDAWKNDFYNEPLIAILYNVLDALHKKHTATQIKEEVNRSVNTILATTDFLPYVKQLKETIKTIKNEIKNYKVTDKFSITKDFKSYNETLHAIKKQLTKISEKQKLVIMVDELDRCEPDYSLNVLNRLHNLFDIPNCVVLLAVNKDLLNSVIKNKYGEKHINYLDKFFDLTFSLPIEGNIDIRIRHAEMFLLEFLSEEQLQYCGLFKVIITELLSHEPRIVVKFFEKLRFIINQFETITEKYDYSCLTAFILLKQINLHTFMLKEYSRNFRYIDLNDENCVDTKIFPGNLKNYIKTNSKSRYVGGLYTERDSSVIKFLIMINVVRCHCDTNRLYNIASHFTFSMDEKVQQDIDKIIEIIKTLN